MTLLAVAKALALVGCLVIGMQSASFKNHKVLWLVLAAYTCGWILGY